jgi:hypothetical protein
MVTALTAFSFVISVQMEEWTLVRHLFVAAKEPPLVVYIVSSIDWRALLGMERAPPVVGAL